MNYFTSIFQHHFKPPSSSHVLTQVPPTKFQRAPHHHVLNICGKPSLPTKENYFFFVRAKFFCIVSFPSIKPSTINHINLRIVDDKILFHVCMLIFLALSWKFSVWLFKCLLKPSKKCLQLFGKNSE